MNNYNGIRFVLEIICPILVPVLLIVLIWGYRAGLSVLPIAVVVSFTMAVYNVKSAEDKQNEPDDSLSEITQKKVIRLRIVGSICIVVSFVLFCFFGR